MENHDGQEMIVLPAKVYAVGSLTTFARGLHVPFLSSYMVDMGASLAQLGTFQSIGHLAPTILQPVWGASSDRIGHAKAFVAFGTSTGLFAVFLFLFAASPVEMILMYAIQSVLFSIQIPTWLSLIGGLMGEENRGDELGRLGMVTSLTSLIATLFSGYIAGFPAIIPWLRSNLGDFGSFLIPPVAAWREAYYIPFYLTAIIGIIASLLNITIKERNDGFENRSFPPIHRLLSEPGEFRRFCFIATFFSFAMSMAWPFFIVVQRVWLENTLLEIAIASVIMTGVAVPFTVPFGRLSDRIGRKPLIVLGRGILFVIPFLYAFAFNTYMIYLANAVAGLSIAASMNAHTAYIYDVAPVEERGSYLAVFNTFTGVVFLAGSLFAGIIGELLIPYLGAYFAVFTMLVISGVLRFIGSFFYLMIKESRKYTSTLRDQVRYTLERIRPAGERI